MVQYNIRIYKFTALIYFVTFASYIVLNEHIFPHNDFSDQYCSCSRNNEIHE